MVVLDDAGAFGQKPVRAIFVDTCWEPTSVYRTLCWLRRKVSFPAFITHNGRSLKRPGDGRVVYGTTV